MTMAPSTSSEELPVHDEPVLDLANIQGNMIAGFRKGYQTLLYVHIDDVGKFKSVVVELARRLATAETVRTFNLAYQQLRDQGNTASIRSTWVNIAFSFAALSKLIGERTTVFFADQGFRDGFAEEATGKGLATSSWKALDGDGDNTADALIMVAADAEDDVTREVSAIKTMLDPDGGARVVDHDQGSPEMTGKEHFGYRDGISQPGLRGRGRATPDDLLTPRPFGPGQGRPGQELIWPGEFVFGYQGQVGSPDGVAPGGDSRYDGVGALQVPEEWGKDGSYVVFRRFDQDVYRFHQFLQKKNQEQTTSDKDDDLPGAQVVGRWRSGAPIMRTPTKDIEELGQNDDANNYFSYLRPPTATIARTGKNPGPPDDFPLARADPHGSVCPLAAHIRRANPRDDADFAGGREHRLVRRGIPFGKPSKSTPQTPVKDDESRGLLFLAYMTSIDRQFNRVSAGWSSVQQASVEGVDTDMLLAGTGSDGTPWITLSGGGNYFAPSISAVQQLAE